MTICAGEAQPRRGLFDRTPFRNFDSARTTQILAGERLGATLQLVARALKHQMAAALPVTRAKVHNLVGRAHHAGFVFDHNDRVAEIAQAVKDADEAFGVARMKADARFVEDIQCVHEARAEAGCEIHALGFATGERARWTVERKIAKTHIDQVAESSADFVEDKGERVVQIQSGRGLPQSKTCRRARSVLECGSPLPLWIACTLYKPIGPL